LDITDLNKENLVQALFQGVFRFAFKTPKFSFHSKHHFQHSVKISYIMKVIKRYTANYHHFTPFRKGCPGSSVVGFAVAAVEQFRLNLQVFGLPEGSISLSRLRNAERLCVSTIRKTHLPATLKQTFFRTPRLVPTSSPTWTPGMREANLIRGFRFFFVFALSFELSALGFRVDTGLLLSLEQIDRSVTGKG
jgi:hypothetical protein